MGEIPEYRYHDIAHNSEYLELIILLKFAIQLVTLVDDSLDILCGGMSQKRGCCSGGAGGTFVSINGRRNPLVIAGGGGGTRGYEEDDPDGQPGNLEVRTVLSILNLIR